MIRPMLSLALLALLAVSPLASAQATLRGAAVQVPPMDEAHRQLAAENVDAGVAYLLSRQNPDGGWGRDPRMPGSHPAITALVLKALAQHPRYDANSEPVRRGTEYLLRSVQPNGGIYDPRIGYENYTTSVAVSALAAIDAAKYRPQIANAAKYIRGIQITEGTQTPQGIEITREHPFYGGTSYGQHGRPDLSNLAFSVEAMHDAGVPADDPFYQDALVFLSRVQNRSESNDQPWAAVVDDGGFIYATATAADNPQPESKAGEVIVGGQRGLRSYGSMTYSGFKSMLYANVDRDDPRVRAAFDWIRRNWRLDSNPNMPGAQSREGLYYYYQVFAKALRAYGQDMITDEQGIPHNWREELVEVLDEQRRPDGSWINEEDRWQEGSEDLVTAYVVLALQETLR